MDELSNKIYKYLEEIRKRILNSKGWQPNTLKKGTDYKVALDNYIEQIEMLKHAIKYTVGFGKKVYQVDPNKSFMTFYQTVSKLKYIIDFIVENKYLLKGSVKDDDESN